MSKNISHYIFYALSAVLSLWLGIFIFLLFVEFTVHIDFFAIFTIIALLGYFGGLFSSFGENLLKRCTNYVRVFSVSTLAAASTMLVGITIPLSIGKYYDKKAALQPEWIYDLNLSFLLGSVLTGFVLACMIFKKYYKKQEESSKKLFSVKITGRAGLIYREDAKTLMVDSEMLVGEYDMVIYADSINKWEPPNDNHQFTDEEKERIKSNIASELKSLKIEWS